MVSLTSSVPATLARLASAAPKQKDERILVVIELGGGNDGINTVVPFGNDGYARSRINLRLAEKELHKLNNGVALHPNMRPAKELIDDGRLAIIQGVGYPQADRSHFRSMNIWHSGNPEIKEEVTYGWLGRALDQRKQNDRDRANSSGVFVGEQQTPPAMLGRESVVTALSRAEDLELLSQRVVDLQAAGAIASQSSLNQFVVQQFSDAYASAERVQSTAKRRSTNVDYPATKLASNLKLVSQLLHSGTESRVFYTIQDGYDTHFAQLLTHSRLLGEFSGAVKAFLDDLKRSELAQRVVVLAFSEFGRRVKENGTQGTDHGTSGPVFLAGEAVTAGLHGQTPDLCDLSDGDLKIHIDFRRIYATLLDEWLGLDATPLLLQSFEHLPLFA